MTGRKNSKPKADPPGQTGAVAGEESTGESTESEAKPRPKGHGRNGSEAYRGGSWIDVAHPSLTAGDACPACDLGTVSGTAGHLIEVGVEPSLGGEGGFLIPMPISISPRTYCQEMPPRVGRTHAVHECPLFSA